MSAKAVDVERLIRTFCVLRVINIGKNMRHFSRLKKREKKKSYHTVRGHIFIASLFFMNLLRKKQKVKLAEKSRMFIVCL